MSSAQKRLFTTRSSALMGSSLGMNHKGNNDMKMRKNTVGAMKSQDLIWRPGELEGGHVGGIWSRGLTEQLQLDIQPRVKEHSGNECQEKKESTLSSAGKCIEVVSTTQGTGELDSNSRKLFFFPVLFNCSFFTALPLNWQFWFQSP